MEEGEESEGENEVEVGARDKDVADDSVVDIVMTTENVPLGSGGAA